MRVIAHLSDLHFGRVALDVVTPLAAAVHRAEPDLVVVSGDFTQNGRPSEFRDAHTFLNRLPRPILTVPGNHDMPFLNLWKRAMVRLALYKRYISTDLEPFWTDGDLAVMGVSTARFVPLRGGRISEWQVRRIEEKLCWSEATTRVLVTHHPFDLHEQYPKRQLVGRARMAMARIARSVDILLAGHMHVSHSGHTAVRYRIHGQSAIFVQAGTATSTRGRGEPNAFNLIKIDRPDMVVERHQWNPDTRHFECICTDTFRMSTIKACITPEHGGTS